MSHPAYAELHAHTNFSFLDGASHPEELAGRAAELGLAALAVTDHDGVYGAVRLSTAAVALKLKPIVGMEITLTGDRHLTLLARDREGYANICRLATEAHHDRPKGEAQLALDALSRHTTGLVGLSGCRQGEIPQAALAGDLQRAAELAAAHAAMFEAGCFFLELQDHLLEEDRVICNALLEVSRRTGIPAVATNDAHYHHPARRRLQDVLVCIKHTASIDRAGRLLRPNGEYSLKSPRQMAALFAGVPEAVRNTIAIAAMCAFDLSRPLSYGLPDFPVPAGHTPDTYMEEQVWKGVETRYRPVSAEVRRRVTHELRHVKDLDLAGYFLIVRDIVDYCHRNDILVNTRGSAPGSILCYALGISMVEPISAGLLFERFLSPRRGEPPDIDLDIEHQERERVIQYVYERYGRDHAAMVANVIAFRGRSAVRDVGKALGLPLAQVDRLAKLLHWHQTSDMEAEFQEALELPSEVPSRTARDLIDLCRQIDDFPRHLGIHTGGMIISSRPLAGSVPIEPATMPGRTVVQWDKDGCSDAGLLKIDLLGLGILTLIHRAFRHIEQRHGRRFELAGFSYDDPKVYDSISRADTLGVFQVESRAQISTLPRTRPRCFYDLVIEIAIIRPGPMSTKMHRRWILRRLGREPVQYLWPGLEPVLRRTLGLPIFQEQCMQMAMVAAGFSPAKADALRQAMSRKRSLQHIQALRDDLMAGMAANGVPEAIAQQIYTQIEGYAGYGFPEAHSCAFALLVYVSAWLKLYYAAEFTCAILNSQPMGFYHPHTLIGDAQRHGVTVKPVDVHQSRYECTLEADGSVRMGYRYVEGIGEAYTKTLDGEMAAGPYASLEDFCRRTRLPVDILQNLAAAGAFGCFGLDRRDALWRVQAHAAAHAVQLPGLAGQLEEPVVFRPAGPMVQARMDFAATGLSTRFRGMEFHRPALQAAGVLTATGLRDLAARLRSGRHAAFISPLPVGFPLPKGEGQGEGRDQSIPTSRAQSFRADPRKRGVDSIGVPRSRPRKGHPRDQTADTLHNVFEPQPVARPLGRDSDPPPAFAERPDRYGERARRLGNPYDGRGSGLQSPDLGDAAVMRRSRAHARTGVRVRVAGLVINRQTPPTAKGFVFLTLEDETGLVNIILSPAVFARCKRAILDESMAMVAGELEDEDGAVHVMARAVLPIAALAAPVSDQAEQPDRLKSPPSRDFH